MILTLLMMALVVALGATATSLSIGNLRGSSSAQQAGTALDAAEAGVAQAISHIRANGTRKIRCYPTACTANHPWTKPAPVSATVAGGGRWEAYICPIKPGVVPPECATSSAAVPNKFLVHSSGTAGDLARRIIVTEVTVAPIELPKGIFGRTINLGGNVDLHRISMFTTGCVFKRDKLKTNPTEGVDLAYGMYAGVHSSQVITESQSSGHDCPDTDTKAIHRGSDFPCNSKYPYDQDRLGGKFQGVVLPPACSGLTSSPGYVPRDFDGDGQDDVTGSFIRNDSALFKNFGMTRPALTDSELEQLRATAQAQGNYYESASDWSVPSSANPHSVLFFDLAGQTVDLNDLGSPSSLWARPALLGGTDPGCKDASLVVVIMGGNAKMNSNTRLAASIYLGSGWPNGQLKDNGNAKHVGMLYGDTLDFTGTFDAALDGCYIENPSPSLFTVTAGTYRELDRS